MLDGQPLQYRLRRSARRTLVLQVDAEGLRVLAPWRATQADIDAAIRQHALWLHEKLGARRPALVWQLQEGAVLPVFGRPCRIGFGSVRSAQWRSAADGSQALLLPARGDPLAALQRVLAGRALAWFAERVAHHCARLGRPVPPVRLTSARTRWGSCSLRSGIRLHWRLVHLSPELADYVVAHECAHLIEMNHSPRFWAVVETLYPDWRKARAELRQAAAGLPQLGAGDAFQPPSTED